MSGNALPASKVEEMFEHFVVKQSANYIATRAGVARATAKKYIEEGDPGRGIEAFAYRFVRMMRKQTSVTEKRFIYTNAAALAALQDQIKELDDLIKLGAMALRKQILKQGVRLTDVAKAIQIRNDVVYRMKPFGEKEMEQTSEVEEFDGRSSDELRFYAQHGCFPEDAPESVVARGVWVEGGGDDDGVAEADGEMEGGEGDGTGRGRPAAAVGAGAGDGGDPEEGHDPLVAEGGALDDLDEEETPEV